MNYELIVRFNIYELMLTAGIILAVFASWIYHMYRNMNLTNELEFTKRRLTSAQDEAEGWWKRYCEAKGIGGKHE